MLKEHRVDLHVHSCLSPCADSAMLPPAIAQRARASGLAGIAICDHNSGRNAAAVREAGRAAGLAVLPGMEVSSREEIHLLALFDTPEELQRFAFTVSAHLPGRNDPEAFGEQIVVDSSGEPLELEEALLAGSTSLSAAELVERIHALGGLAIAAHVDRSVFSVVSQLGFIPPELELDAAELSPHSGAPEAYAGHGLPLVRGSDAHFPEDLGRAFSTFRIAEVTVAELRKALRGEEGRALIR